MEVNVEEEDIAMSILCGLPQGFENLIVSIDTIADESRLTLDFVKSRLLQEEQRMDDRDGSSTKTDSAFLTNGQNQNKFGRKCTYCKKKGHTETFCWKKQKDEKANKDAHTGLLTKTQNYDSDAENSEVSSVDHVCLMVRSKRLENANPKFWHIDSGCTSHMTYDRRLFTDLETVPPFDVGIGNDSSAKAFGLGTIHLTIIVNGKTRRCEMREVAYVPELTYHLLSVSVMEEAGMKIKFENSQCEITKGERRESWLRAIAKRTLRSEDS